MARVKCYYCNEMFNREKEATVRIGNRRYAHAACHEKNGSVIDVTVGSESFKELENYIKKIFGKERLDARVYMQIKQFTTANSYTYENILKALKYSVEVKNNPIEKMNGGIGIVPYIYEESLQYYLKLEEKQNRNKDKEINEFIPKEKIVSILNPKRKVKKNDGFDFLD